jgi:hypothetical protein
MAEVVVQLPSTKDGEWRSGVDWAVWADSDQHKIVADSTITLSPEQAHEYAAALLAGVAALEGTQS